MVNLWYNTLIMKIDLKKLMTEADEARERVSQYTPQKRAELLKSARATIKKSRKKV